ncbi:hypothetical protein JHD46_07240, partial [Sulfurimonas sp. SAG-AH-194-C20]
GFGSSLFGVISAIILGLMGYILNKNQETLIEGVEDWLKGRIIDSGGASSSSMTNGDGEQLPEQRSSFMDVFIDNISTLSKAMGAIAQTNERLHSITIASVQQARDEHELSYELFGSINDNLASIDENAKSSTNILDTRLSNIENIIATGQRETLDELKLTLSTLSDTLVDALSANNEAGNQQNEKITSLLESVDNKLQAQLEIITNDTTKDRLNSLKEELQTIATILSKNEKSEDSNFKEMISSLSGLTQKLQEEMTLLTSIEKLSKIQITDARKQSTLVQTSLSKQEVYQDSSAVLHKDSKELLEKQRAILELLVGKNEENLDELRRISSITTTDGSISADMHQRDESKKDSRGFFSKIFG